IAAARAANGPGGPRHELAHAGYVHPDDVPRFAELNVAPDFSPILWHPSAIIRSVLQAVGVRGERYWPTRDLIDAGATVVAGSDWPSAVASPNPWPGVEAFVTRRNPFEEKEDTLWSAQAVTLEEALRIWTVNGAETIGLAGDTGVIAPGYRADLIVLDRNLFEIDVNDISGTEVLLTMVEGEVAHAGGDFASLAEPSSDAAASELNADAGE
ncbi:MAG: amidohydrolase family protein, partial [Caulobacterales bacterium]|nr:amidohydrolase family protein [Caulobacterales bacterium]